jgi:hypothetical protein
MIVGNYFRDCGTPGTTGAMYVGGPRTIAANNFMTRSGLDGVYVTLADSSILSNNLIVNSGNSSHTGYGIRSIGDTVNPIIMGNMIADDRTPKYMDVGISISENSGIFVGNSVADTLSKVFGTAGNAVDQVFSGNRQGLNSVSAPLGNRDQNSFLSDTLTGNASLDRFNHKICHFAASGADRNADPVSVWKSGDELWIKNVGTTYDIVFDSAGLHQHLTPGQMGHFVYDGSAWERLAYDAGQSLPLTGFLTGLMPPVNVVKPSGTSTDVPSETVLTHADDGSAANAYVGMTLYNVTDWVAGTVTASTSTTITVATGSMSWADGDVYQLSPGPSQSGSMFYIGTAGTIRHPLTAGYSAGYFVNVAGVVTVDPVSDSMIFQGVLNSAFAVLDAGDCIDSPATKGSYYVIHNKSATEAVGLGFSNVWVDGGAS